MFSASPPQGCTCVAFTVKRFQAASSFEGPVSLLFSVRQVKGRFCPCLTVTLRQHCGGTLCPKFAPMNFKYEPLG